MAETFLPSSTNIDQVTYDRETREMQITFKDGRAYSYANVPNEVYLAFQHAPSAGQFFYRQIRGRYLDEEI